MSFAQGLLNIVVRSKILGRLKLSTKSSKSNPDYMLMITMVAFKRLQTHDQSELRLDLLSFSWNFKLNFAATHGRK